MEAIKKKQIKNCGLAVKSAFLKMTPNGLIRWLRIKKHKINYTPPVGRICFGDMRSLKPFDDDFGFRRGGAIDRYYIEKFLRKNSTAIQGSTLEILNSAYTKKFGGNRVTHSDILDINPNNKLATIIANLAQADNVPSDTYDCVILTQTLQLIYDVKSTIIHIHRILKPGGVLLMTVPGITNFNYKIYGANWSWSFTEASVQKLLGEAFKRENIKIEIYGNVMIAASFLYGVGAGEITEEEYNYTDPDYQFIITARAEKSEKHTTCANTDS